jgi:7-keto-8-aminopelargonate synthetase-like enzyme
VLAPLRELCALAEKYGADVIVDEAHATGILGSRGRGVCELLGVEDRVALRIGTLSKAIGSIGGFVTGRRQTIDWLWNRARTQIFSTAVPPAACAAACAALDIIASEPGRREKLLKLSERLRQGINSLALKTIPSGIGPIIPILLGESETALDWAQFLETSGFLVGAIRPPSVPAGTSRLRIGVMATHETENIDRLLDALHQASLRCCVDSVVQQAPNKADAC